MITRRTFLQCSPAFSTPHWRIAWQVRETSCNPRDRTFFSGRPVNYTGIQDSFYFSIVTFFCTVWCSSVSSSWAGHDTAIHGAGRSATGVLPTKRNISYPAWQYPAVLAVAVNGVPGHGTGNLLGFPVNNPRDYSHSSVRCIMPELSPVHPCWPALGVVSQGTGVLCEWDSCQLI